jgi:hypothetical protein
MRKTFRVNGLVSLSLVVLPFSFFGIPAEAQWSPPDASGNITNTNTGQVIVKSSSTNAGNLFYVNPQGTGSMVVGEANPTVWLGTTALQLSISAYKNGFSQIQSIQSNGYTWGNLALNPSGGMVGIGTTAPAYALDIQTNTTLDCIRIGYNNSSGMVRLHPNSLTGGAYNNITQAGDAGIVYGISGSNPPNFGFVITPWAAATSGIRLTPAGNVLIGKGTQTNSTYILDVNGTARANQVVVNTTGADYVFDSGYRLSSLEQLEAYVRKEHHLPGIASAAQMQQEGVNLGDNQTQLLAKIEELTLYIIQQDKETQALKDEQEKETQILKDKIKALEARNRTLESLEQRIEKLEDSKK